MKQHITVEQLKEIDATKLDRWMKSVKYTQYMKDIYNSNNKTYLITMYGLAAKKVTIGKMIEILRANKIIKTSTEFEVSNETWYLIESGGNTFEGQGLCDALFEALKYILEVNDV